MYDTSKYEHFKFVCFAGRGPFRVTLTKKVSEMLTFFSVFNQFCVYIREKWHSQKNVHKVLGAFLLLLTYQLRRSVPKQKKRFIVIFRIKKYKRSSYLLQLNLNYLWVIHILRQLEGNIYS